MNNWIQYYYNIFIDNISSKDEKYFFSIDNYDYFLFQYKDSIDQINNTYLFSKNLHRIGIYCHEIMVTKDNDLYIVVDGIIYILLRSYKGLDKTITIEDVLEFQRYQLKDKNTENIYWKNLWEKKLDYLEYQVNQFGVMYPKMRESFGYFSGYAELAIILLNNKIEKKNIINVLSHKRIRKDSTLFDLYNPFNLIIDTRIRDISEYYKSFFNNKETFINKFMETILKLNLNSSEYYLLFVRMLYPSMYFDALEKIINNEVSENIIDKFINNVTLYENMYKQLYYYLVPYLPNIEWLRY